jgi:hypothetical protein
MVEFECQNPVGIALGECHVGSVVRCPIGRHHFLRWEISKKI